ncbi:DUF1592 domain-containing protein [Roseimaritima ulvae]|uniref:Planctomycete cytochrome C n=1 Tax=Roseimaritima ulvae TaxID=980254 RepID=A0A5B9QQ53_9BACT|nr:DUF1592 domain-containing protein [Roseimaritima ulvae]QEG39645.1 hypothetical protein UC8_16410 [Roseimaritima ulvae]
MPHVAVQSVILIMAACLSGSILLSAPVLADSGPTAVDDLQTAADFVEQHCLDCHNDAEAARDFNLEPFADDASWTPRADWDTSDWEKILKRLVGRQMPPADASRPEESEYIAAIGALRRHLDRQADAFPPPPATTGLRRLTRTQYANAIRDLLRLEIDAADWLPADSSSHGFDNITVTELSPTQLERYVTAAQQLSRLAVGGRLPGPLGKTVRVPGDQSQSAHVEGLPLGTRGGVLIPFTFPRSGAYEIRVRLARDRDELVEGLNGTYHLDVLLDDDPIDRFAIKRPKGRDHTQVDAHLKLRVHVSAGLHRVGVTFPRNTMALQEIKRQPFDVQFNQHRHPRQAPAVQEVSIVGPLDRAALTTAEDHDSPSRQAIFCVRPNSPDKLRSAAQQVIRPLLRKAYRRPVTAADLDVPMRFFDQASEPHPGDDSWTLQDRFDAGVEAALSAILVNPHFLFHVDSGGQATGNPDIELASRLSFFLWSSIPDERLLDLAEQQRLHDPEILQQQVRRMLADQRSQSLVDNFADQWLYLRNLDSITPDLRLFPDFDANLREAFRGETQHFFADVVRRNRSVLDLIRSEDTFLNERLAKHYGIPHVYGSHFRRVRVTPEQHRGGLLRHGSLLMVTSYATRTAPTLRGSWVLENILGTPPPPPPPNIPTLKEKTPGKLTTLRDQLALHRSNPSCASCHDLIDPVGFALDQFDAVGRWRERMDGQPIDVRGRLPDGTVVEGVDQLEAGILQRPEMFVQTLTAKLLTYAIGRHVDRHDGPAIRGIVDAAAADDYRFASLVTALVLSPSFQMRSQP